MLNMSSRKKIFAYMKYFIYEVLQVLQDSYGNIKVTELNLYQK